MIQLSKTAAVLSVVLCGVLTTSIQAQEPGEHRPRPRSRSRSERSARPAPRPAPDPRAAEPTPPAEATPFAAPPGLSEEAIRSFKEIPPGHEVDDGLTPERAVAPPDEAPAPPRPSRAAPPLPSRSTPARIQQRPEYIVEPPDMLVVEVLEALPGRPISGERLVRPDGRISLGFYGEVPIAGLTIPEIKEKIVLHMRKFLNDEILGLAEIDPVNEDYQRDKNGRIVIKDPRQTDRVFVDVTAYNSQNDYVLGEVSLPGRLPYTGGDTVLDLVQYAGGLLPTADKSKIRLIRSFPKGSPARVLPVNYEEIAMGTDSSTNYAILPNDRLVIPHLPSSPPEGDPDRGASRQEENGPDGRDAGAPAPRMDSRAERSGYFNRRTYLPVQGPNAELEKRIDELEKKLDRLIEVVEKSQPKPGGEPEEKRAVKLPDGNPFGDIPQPAGRTEPSPGRRPGETIGPAGPRPRRVEPEGPRPPAVPRPRVEAPPDAPPE
jgi:protein involved in polysaccharide export with SLBB domain